METIISSIEIGEYTLIAQRILHARNIELGDDPRTEIQVAVSLGHLTLDEELAAKLNVELPAARAEV